MKAAVCREFGKPLVIEEITLKPPKAGEVEVEISACAVCHSDITYAKGDWGGHLPAVYGHEAAGWVTQTGPGRSRYKQGQRVLVTLIRSCGHCPSCTTGVPTSCDNSAGQSHIRDKDGKFVAQAMETGAFAEKVVVHESQLVALPDDLPLDAASLLACGVLTGVGAVTNTAKVRPGAHVVVIGAGGVGLNTIQGAAIAGASRIIAMDLSEEKLAAAREFGATDGIIATDPDVVDQVKALTNGRGADHVFVTVGAAPAFASAPHMLAKTGSVVLVGMPASGVEIPYDPGTMAAYNQSILGSKMGQAVLPRDIPWLIDMWRQGRLKLEELITGRYPLEQINEAIEHTVSGTARRNVIIIKEEA